MLLLPIGLLGAAPAGGSNAVAAGLLDALSCTVAGAYGLRLLRGAYAGAAVRVRRSSDNAEQDVGFASGGAMDTTALLAFCGAGDGFVTKWYDQSGAGQNVAQAVATSQPQIVSGGAVVTLGNTAGKPALATSNAASQCLVQTAFSFPAASAFAGVSVAQIGASDPGGSLRLISYAVAGNNDYGNTQSCVVSYRHGNQLGGYYSGGGVDAPITAAPFQAASVFDGANHRMTLDGAAYGPMNKSGTLAATGTLGLGCDPGQGECWDGRHAEHLIIAGPLSAADQSAIRASQQSYFGTP